MSECFGSTLNVCHVCAVPTEVRRGIGYPEVEFPRMWVLGTEAGPLEEQAVLLAAALSVSMSFVTTYIYLI